MPATKIHPAKTEPNSDAPVWYDHQLQSLSRLRQAKVDPAIYIVGVSDMRHHIGELNAKKAAIQQPMRITPINR